VVWCNAYSEKAGKGAVYKTAEDSVIRSSSAHVEDDCEPHTGASGYRIPTEAEWELAARGGVPGTGAPWNYPYAGGASADAVAWTSENSGGATHEVGGKAPNDLGLYDMSGNIAEWCWDSIYGSKLLRGGFWNDEIYRANVSNNYITVSSEALATHGFRVVCAE
jgi:formylglycine-generating enzyme required for sulfatase activity